MMYLLNIVILLFNPQLQYKSLKKPRSHSILFATIDDIDYTDYRDDNLSIPYDNDSDNDNDNSFISINSNKYKKLNGYDQRYVNNIEEFINHKLLLNKIDGFFTNKKLLDRLLKHVKERNATLHHQYESDIFEQIRQYNNDNRNKSELTHDIFAGGLANDW